MINVYYDGACPKCIKDGDQNEKLAGSAVKNLGCVICEGRGRDLGDD